MTEVPPIASIVIELLDSLPPADRAPVLREQIRLIEAAAGAKRQRLAEIAFAALAPIARAFGIELVERPILVASDSGADDPDELEAELVEMDEVLPLLVEALAVTEAGSARAT